MSGKQRESYTPEEYFGFLSSAIIELPQVRWKPTANAIKWAAERIAELEAGFTKLFDADEARIDKLSADLRTLADAVIGADGMLCNDLYATRVKNAHDILDDEPVQDVALNWMSDE